MKTILILIALFTLTTPVVAKEGWFHLDQPFSTADYSNKILVSAMKGSAITLSRKWSANGNRHLEFIAEVESQRVLLFKSGPHTYRVTVLSIELNRGRVKLDVEVDPNLDE